MFALEEGWTLLQFDCFVLLRDWDLKGNMFADRLGVDQLRAFHSLVRPDHLPLQLSLLL